MHRSEQLQMPAPASGGLIKTLNKMGYMTVHLNLYSRQFVDFAPSAPGPVLEVGAAYGDAAIAAAEAGADVIANDIDYRHLEILLGRTPNHAKQKITTLLGTFPNLNFAPSSLGAVLISRVFHFFDGASIELSARRLFEWLAPLGKVFVVAETPFLKPLKDFIPIYQQRKENGDPWPGWVENVIDYAPKDRKGDVPTSMNLLDCEVLTRVFTSAGFSIETTGMFAHQDYPDDLRLDGREGVGLVATKGDYNQQDGGKRSPD